MKEEEEEEETIRLQKNFVEKTNKFTSLYILCESGVLPELRRFGTFSLLLFHFFEHKQCARDDHKLIACSLTHTIHYTNKLALNVVHYMSLRSSVQYIA